MRLCVPGGYVPSALGTATKRGSARRFASASDGPTPIDRRLVTWAEMAGNEDESRVCGYRSSTPKSIDEVGSPLIAAGFQYKAPEASTGMPVDAPPIERLTAPAPVKRMPICACTGATAHANTRRDATFV